MNSTGQNDTAVFSTDQKHSLIAAVVILLVGLPFATMFDGFWRYFLGFPSAQLCSLFFGSDCIATPEGYLLTNAALPVHVTKACSAASFFILLLVMMAMAVMPSCRGKDLLKLVWVVPLAYGITLMANTARIIGGWLTGRWARSTLPENLWAGVHLGTGVVVFLTVLIAVYLLLKWRPCHGDTGRQTAAR